MRSLSSHFQSVLIYCSKGGRFHTATVNCKWGDAVVPGKHNLT